MPERLTRVALIMTLALLPLSVLDWAALHDIWWDYASETLVKRFSSSGVERWPEWTRAKGEWDLVMTNLYLRTALVLVNTVLLGLIVRQQRSSRRAPISA